MQNGVTTAIASTNEARDFYGSIAQQAEPDQAWALAVAGHEERGSLRSGRPRLPR